MVNSINLNTKKEEINESLEKIYQDVSSMKILDDFLKFGDCGVQVMPSCSGETKELVENQAKFDTTTQNYKVAINI